MAACALTVAARSSPLSRAQVQEVQVWLHGFDSNIKLIPILLDTYGDRDLATSLRNLPPSDFFTRDIDRLVQNGAARLAVHSAKDLPPEPAHGLVIAAFTPCLDSRDALVLREGLTDVPRDAVVGTSSLRRDEQVRKRFPHVQIVDLRGTIHARLARLQGDCHAVVVAECALIRLGLTGVSRLYLEGPTVERQGQLALVCRHDDYELRDLLQQVFGKPLLEIGRGRCENGF